MNVGIVGLGLIGGSMAKAFKKYTEHTVSVYDINEETVKKAIDEGAADKKLFDDFYELDLLILALYPEHCINFIEENANKIPKKTVVIDCAGIKKKVCEKISEIAEKKGFTYIGGHPMAGLEKSGYEASMSGLFKGASMILTPKEGESENTINFLRDTLAPLGFTRFQISTPDEHDRIIAFTSQLAHVVSSAYIQSPTAESHLGFSAGSFRDMTRVAKLNEYMWTELFLENKNFLEKEITLLINSLEEFKKAIKNSEEEKLISMLRRGRIRKENSLSMEKNK